MAKKQSFADKASKKKHAMTCPICQGEIAFIKYVKAEKSSNGWRYRTNNVGVCECNRKELFG